MPGADFRGTAGNAGKGVMIADGFQTVPGVTEPRVIKNTTITFDPPSLATGTFAKSGGIAVAGAALGDIIDLYPPYDAQGILYQASVSSVGYIVISLFNASTGTVDLASGTWGVVVKRRV